MSFISLPRIRTLVVILAVVVAGFIWQTLRPTAPADSQIATLNGYSVELIGAPVVVGGNTTFNYRACRTGSASYSLSNLVIGIPGCLPVLNAVSTSPSTGVTIGQDPNSGISGVKWDLGLSSGCRDYSITFEGVLTQTGPVNAAVKASTNVETGIIAGPLCLRTPSNQCGISAPADIVIMFDITGSMTSGELNAQKTAARTLLGEFASATERPRVAIGSFNDTSGSDARIVSGGQLTSSYGNPVTNTGLYAAINSVGSPSGNTPLSLAVDVAQEHLTSGYADPQTPNYLILLSDGIPNLPRNWTNPQGVPGFPATSECIGTPSCNCEAARRAAGASRLLSVTQGTQVFAIFFGLDQLGSSSSCTQADLNRGRDYMRDVLASGPAFFFEGDTGNLSLIFDQISAFISCPSGGYQCGQLCVDGACQANPCPTPTATATPTRTATATASPTICASNTPTRTPTRTPTATPNSCDPSPTATRTATPTKTITATATNSPTRTASPTTTPTKTASPTITATATRTATITATASRTPTITSTATATRTSTPTKTQTPTITQTATRTATVTATSSATATVTWSPTSTRTATPSASATATATQTSSPTSTRVPTETPTLTPSATSTSTPFPTETPTLTPTNTATATSSPTATNSPTATSTPTPTPTPECFDVAIQGLQTQIDSNAAQQKALVRSTARRVLARTTNRRVRNLAKATLVDADKLYQEIWAKTWEIPSAFVQCASSSTLCVSASFAEQISFLGAKGRSLNALIEKLVVELRKLEGQKKAAKKIRTQAKQLDTDYQAAVASLPTFQTVCNES